jgi:hypothetical protein
MLDKAVDKDHRPFNGRRRLHTREQLYALRTSDPFVRVRRFCGHAVVLQRLETIPRARNTLTRG